MEKRHSQAAAQALMFMLLPAKSSSSLACKWGDGATCEMVPKKSCGRKRSACKDLFGRGVSSPAGALESFETASFPRLQGPTLRV